MTRKRRFNCIALAVLLALLFGFSVQAKTREIGPGVPPYVPEQELFKKINIARAESQLAPLVWDDSLAAVAKLRASELAESYGHTRPNGSTPQTAYKEAGLYFSKAGENIAQGLEDEFEVYDRWGETRPSRENMFRKEFTNAAVGIYDVTNEDGTVTRYWVMEFMKPREAPADALLPGDTASEPVSGTDIPDTDAVPAP